MKKLSIFLILCSVLSLTACGEKVAQNNFKVTESKPIVINTLNKSPKKSEETQQIYIEVMYENI